MISATYFGEITELDSRAVWYSDEEDGDSDDESLQSKTTQTLKPFELLSHESFRSNIIVNLELTSSLPKTRVGTLIISLSSSSRFKYVRQHSPDMTSTFLGTIGTVGKVFAFSPEGSEADEYTLWLLFDASHHYTSSHNIGYFVEILRDLLHTNFKIGNSTHVVVLSQQFSSRDQLEYLSNCNEGLLKPPFVGVPMAPPSLIKNQFESALFEQFTLSLRPVCIVCLPNPKDFWFDKSTSWPSVPNQVIEHKLNDDNLDKTLIFT